jgi:hypothetical protein
MKIDVDRRPVPLDGQQQGLAQPWSGRDVDVPADLGNRPDVQADFHVQPELVQGGGG